MSVLAIVPARGGSKRVPDKNIKDFCGKPMIGHILDTARESGLFDHIHVSTDCPRIAKVAGSFGFPPEFIRPEDLADDEAPLMPVLKYVAEQYIERGYQLDIVVLLMACAPLLRKEDLHGAMTLFKHQRRPVLSVASMPCPSEWAYRMNQEKVLEPREPGMFAVRSQDLDKSYYDAGAFCIYPASVVLGSKGAGSDMDQIGYVLDRCSSVDIDDPEDWEFAEVLYQGQRMRQHSV